MRRKIWSAKDLEAIAKNAASGGEGITQIGGEGTFVRVGEGGEGRVSPSPSVGGEGGEGNQPSDIRLKDRIERIGTISVGR
jgi:hypothetical protein